MKEMKTTVRSAPDGSDNKGVNLRKWVPSDVYKLSIGHHLEHWIIGVNIEKVD